MSLGASFNADSLHMRLLLMRFNEQAPDQIGAFTVEWRQKRHVREDSSSVQALEQRPTALCGADLAALRCFVIREKKRPSKEFQKTSARPPPRSNWIGLCLRARTSSTNSWTNPHTSLSCYQMQWTACGKRPTIQARKGRQNVRPLSVVPWKKKKKKTGGYISRCQTTRDIPIRRKQAFHDSIGREISRDGIICLRV
jgi:hypothetical protein